MTRKRNARCVKCYDAAWAKYGHRTNLYGEPEVYSHKGSWENVAITQGPRGGYKAECRNCGHKWRVSHKTAHASGFKAQERARKGDDDACN